MREDFVQYFSGAVSDIRYVNNYPWLISSIDEAVSQALEPNDMVLRSDGFVFLYLNVAEMIVVPWERAGGQQFDRVGMTEMVFHDLTRILQLAATLSSLQGSQDVSANSVFQAIAALGESLRTRAENFWGP